MRLKLAGYGGPLYPLLMSLPNGVPFLKATYVNQGYTNFEVLCIGGSGGFGAGIIRTASSMDENDMRRPFGGGPGGGGAQRVSGLLETLPDSCDVEVGSAGADSPDVADTEEPQPGVDGGPSRFNPDDNTCMASGGQGGGAAYPWGFDSYWRAGNGGAAGTGATTSDSGGGSTGASSEFGEDPAVAADSGTWDPVLGIGVGGGGGAGGLSIWTPSVGAPYVEDAPSPGGHGAYHVANQSYYSPGGSVRLGNIGASVIALVGAGAGGGAKATVLNSLFTAYGTRAYGLYGVGIVLIRLTKV